jgi:hypothetical protein
MELSMRDKVSAGNPANERLWLLAAISVIALIYFSTLSVNHNEAEDSLFYLMDISRGTIAEQFHPNHLIYNFINYLFLHTWQLFGYEGSVELPVKIINILGSAGSLFLLYMMASHLKLNFILRYFLVFSVAFSCSYWWYSVECESYILPIVFVLLSFRQLMLIQTDFSKPTNHLLLGMFSAAAILLHQQHSLLGIVILIGYLLIYYLDRQKISWRKFLFRVSLYSLVCFFVVLCSYIAAAVFAKGLTTYDQIENFVMGRYGKMPTKLGYWSVASVILGIIGFGRTVIGGHYLFSFDAFTSFLQKMMPGFMLKEEMFLVRDFSMFKSMTLSVLTAVIIFLMLLFIFQIVKPESLRLIRSHENYSKRSRLFFMLFTAYLVIYSLFNIWWEPQNSEYWIAVVPVFFLMVAFCIDPLIYKPWIRTGTVTIMICLFAVNLFGSILPQTKHENDYWYVFNSWLIKNTNAEDIVVTGSAMVSDAYVRYYSGAEVLSIFPVPDNRPIEKKFQEVVDANRNGRILLSSTIHSPPEEYLNKLSLDNSDATMFFEKSREYLTLLHSDSWQKIYLYNKDHK